jgi:hypothetical protein
MKPSHMLNRFAVLFYISIALSLGGCNLPTGDSGTPTLNVTQAYQTVEARLTEAIAMTPEHSPTPPLRATATPAIPSPSPIMATQTATSINTQLPQPSCDQALPGIPIDVTIPDDTKMRPGEAFTKTWRLQNAGTCTWTSDYALVYFSGEQLGAPSSVPFSENVAPGGSVDLSVDMEAPEIEGTYQSNWKLSNASGVLFGIGPNSDSAFWVRIMVEGEPITTGTPTVTPTVTATTSPTPGIQVSGSATLEIGNLYDLDTNQINSGGEDLAYENVDETHLLVPLENAIMAVFGSIQPTLDECLTANLSLEAIAVDNLLGSFICYRTNMALPGWALVNGLDPDTGVLNLEILTWSIP